MEKKSVTYNNKSISYRTGGKGLPVMLVHGFGEDDSIWRHQEKFLENDFRLIIPQLPGTGQSQLLADTSMESMAETLLQIADAENLESFVLIGHSMGGYTTLAFAEKYPQRLKGFGLFHSSSFADTEEKKSTRRKGIEFVRQHGAAAFLKTATPNLFSEKTKLENPALVTETVESLPYFSDEAIIAYYEAMIKRKDRTEVLRSAKMPILFIIGEHDQAVPPADSLSQSALPEIAYIYMLKASGHLGMLEETMQSNQALKEFLSEIT